MGSFSALDIAVLVLYMGGTTFLGVYLGRGQKSARDYFVASHSIPWWAILFSVVATETSALTFISIPGLAYLGDFSFLQIVVGYIIGRIVVAFVLLPRYYQGTGHGVRAARTPLRRRDASLRVDHVHGDARVR